MMMMMVVVERVLQEVIYQFQRIKKLHSQRIMVKLLFLS